MAAETQRRQVTGERPPPIELEDINVLRTELKGLREDWETLSRDLRTTRRSLATANAQRRELRQKMTEREEETTQLSIELGCVEQDVLALENWRQLAKEEARKAKELRQCIESKGAEDDKRIADLEAVVAQKGRPRNQKAFEAEATRSRREALDEECARMQLLRDYVSGRLPAVEDSVLAEQLASQEEELEEELEEPFRMEMVEELLEDMELNHERAMKNLVDTSNSIIDKKNHTWKRINKGLFISSLLRPERCALQEHPTIREVLDAAEALCRVRRAQNVPLQRPEVAQADEPRVRRTPDVPNNKENSEGESSEGQAMD